MLTLEGTVVKKGEKERVADAGDLACHSRCSLLLVYDLISTQTRIRLDAQVGCVHEVLEREGAVGPAVGWRGGGWRDRS